MLIYNNNNNTDGLNVLVWKSSITAFITSVMMDFWRKMFCCCLVSVVMRLLARCLRNCGLISHGDRSFLSSTKHPHWLWGPSSLLFSGFQGLTAKGSKVARDINLSAVLHLVLRLRIHGAVPPFAHMPLWNCA